MAPRGAPRGQDGPRARADGPRGLRGQTQRPTGWAGLGGTSGPRVLLATLPFTNVSPGQSRDQRNWLWTLGHLRKGTGGSPSGDRNRDGR